MKKLRNKMFRSFYLLTSDILIIHYTLMKEKLNFDIKNADLTLFLDGSYLMYDGQSDKVRLYAAAHGRNVQKIIVDAAGLKQWDSTLVVIVFELEKIARRRRIELERRSFPPELSRLIALAFSVDRKPAQPEDEHGDFLERVGRRGVETYESFGRGFSFLQTSWYSFLRLLAGKSVMRPVDLSFALEDCGYRALPIVSLISFMVGLILAFVGAVQLKTFGAQIYVASLVTIGMTRIMGAIMTGIIMAGRTGASYAATIGTMQVNEEIDALKTMGINPVDFLVLPRIIALTVTMPILTMWADFMGMLGGGFVGVTMLDIPLVKYWDMSVAAISLNNFFVGIFHGLVFGVVTAVCGCYYGVYCGRNADSVGVATTKAVVAAIVWMIVMTGIITVACEVLGI